MTKDFAQTAPFFSANVIFINEIYQNADIISLHIPHTPQSEKMINKDVVENK